MRPLSPAVAVFARSPVFGKVKTRLAAAIGPADALAAHQLLTHHLLEELSTLPIGVVREIWVDGPMREDACLQWASRWSARLRQQQGRDLGARMWHCMRTHLRMRRSVMLLGCDVPCVDTAFVMAAAEQLETSDVVLAPAADGGYGFIGMSREAPEVFRDIDWGTDRVFEQTQQRLIRHGYRYAVLPEVWDVDEEADWRRFVRTYGPFDRLFPRRPHRPVLDRDLDEDADSQW